MMSCGLVRNLAVASMILAGAGGISANPAGVVLRGPSGPPPQPPVSGIVQTATGEPIAGAELYLTPPYGPPEHLKRIVEAGNSDFPMTTSDEQGSFTINLSNRAHYQLIYGKAPGYVDAIESLTHSHYIPYPHHSAPQEPTTYTIIMYPPTTLTGIVRNEEGDPIPGATVEAVPATIKGQYFGSRKYAHSPTNGAGKFTLTDIPETSVSLHVTTPGYAKAFKVVEPGETIEIEINRGATVRGKAIDIEGKPVANLELTMQNKWDHTPDVRPSPNLWSGRALTADDGAFAFLNVPPGEYTFVVPHMHNQKQSHGIFKTPAEESVTVTVPESGDPDSINVPIFYGYSIEGTVVEEGTDTPVPNARVWLTNHNYPHPSVLADEKGSFKLDGIFAEHTYSITATADGFTFSPRRDSVSWGTTQTLQVQVPTTGTVASATLEMFRDKHLTGRVIDSETSSPISGAQVKVVKNHYASHTQVPEKQTTSTDENGHFSLVMPREEPHRVRVEAEGYAPGISPPFATTDEQDITISMQKGVSASGIVYGPDGNPFEGASITGSFRIQGKNRDTSDSYSEQVGTVSTTADGKFTFDNLPPGTSFGANARAQHHAYSRSESVPLHPGEDVTSVTLHLEPSEPLSGTVQDETGKPVAGMFIRAHLQDEDETSTRTRIIHNQHIDRNGRFQFDDLPIGTYRLELSGRTREFFDDIKTGQTDVVLKIGEGKTIDVEARSGYSNQTGATLHGRVIDYKTSQPITNFIAVMARQQVKPDPDVKGGFIATGLNVGTPYQTVHITAPGYAPLDSDSIYVFAGQTRIDQTFAMGPGGSITGRTIDHNTSQPLSHVTVELSHDQYSATNKPSEKPIVAVTDEQGRFVLPNVGSGRKVVAFRPPDTARFKPTQEVVEVQHDKTTNMGDIPIGSGGTIEGKLIRTPDNTPIANASVFTANQPHNPVRTNDAGEFKITDLQSGLYHVIANNGEASAWIGIENLETKELTLEVGSAILNGQVTRGGKPLECTVFARKVGPAQSVVRSTTADANGKFTLEQMTPGRWQVRFTGSGDHPFTAEEAVVLPPSGENVTHTFNLPSGSVRVKVIDEQNAPVSGATVIVREQANASAALLPMPHRTNTNSEGIAEIQYLGDGNYAITALANNGQRGVATNQSVKDQETTEANITLKPVEGGTLVSTATDQTSNQPVASAWLHLISENGDILEHTAERNAAGILTLQNIPAGKYRVQISSFGYSVTEHEVEITAGQTRELSDTLYPAGAARWVIRDSEGAPVVAAECRIEMIEGEMNEEPRTGQTDNDGLFAVRGLATGVYQATARTADGRTAEARINISAGNATDAISLLK